MEEKKHKVDVSAGTAVKTGAGVAVGVGLAGLILPVALMIGIGIICFVCMIIGSLSGTA